MIPTFYQLFGLPEDASMEELHKAYKSLTLICRPDRFYSWASPYDISFLIDIHNRLNGAYKILNDPEMRKNYNLDLHNFRSAFPALDLDYQRQVDAFLNRWQELQNQYKQYQQKSNDTLEKLRHAHLRLNEWLQFSAQQTSIIAELTASEKRLLQDHNEREYVLQTLQSDNQQLQAQLLQQQQDYASLYHCWQALTSQPASATPPPAAAPPIVLNLPTYEKGETRFDEKEEGPPRSNFFTEVKVNRQKPYDIKERASQRHLIKPRGVRYIVQILQKRSEHQEPICTGIKLQYKAAKTANGFINFFTDNYPKIGFTFSFLELPCPTVLVTYKDDKVLVRKRKAELPQEVGSLFDEFKKLVNLEGIPVTQEIIEETQAKPSTL
jgi:curved DNA-binding protein CbpA